MRNNRRPGLLGAAQALAPLDRLGVRPHPSIQVALSEYCNLELKRLVELKRSYWRGWLCLCVQIQIVEEKRTKTVFDQENTHALFSAYNMQQLPFDENGRNSISHHPQHVTSHPIIIFSFLGLPYIIILFIPYLISINYPLQEMNYITVYIELSYE